MYGKEKTSSLSGGYKPVAPHRGPTLCQDMARPAGDGGEHLAQEVTVVGSGICTKKEAVPNSSHRLLYHASGKE